jgi:tetratricopeptide (TPR) repeat protein
VLNSRGSGWLLALVIACGGSEAPPPKPDSSAAIAEARKHADAALPDGLSTSIAALRTAAEATPDDLALAGQLQRTIGLGALLYALPGEPVDPKRFVKGGPGWRDHVVGWAAFELSRVKDGKGLLVIGKLLDDELATDARDPWLQWLRARVAMLLGDRGTARSVLHPIEKSFPLAAIDRAALFADEGDAGKALERLLALDIAQHPLAKLARATIRAEAAAGLANKGWGDDASADELANAFAQVTELQTAPAIIAHREVASLLMALASDRYDQVATSLKKLGSTRALPMDCGMWKRIAWAHVELGRGDPAGKGDFRTASITRTRCAFPTPGMETVDAALQLGLGRPDIARPKAATSDLRWARVIEAEAALQLGDAKGALDVIAKGAPGELRPVSFATRVLEQQARIMLGKGKQRDAAITELARLADGAKNQRARHALGAAYHAIGDLAAAKRELRRVVLETSPTSPNPYGVRTRTLLAEIAFSEGDLELAQKELQQAITIHEANQPAKVLQARIALRSNDPDQALAVMAIQRKLGSLTPAAELVVAEALVVRKDVTADQRAQARQLITGLVGKPTMIPAELGRVAALVDPALPKQLALPVGKLPGGGI